MRRTYLTLASLSLCQTIVLMVMSTAGFDHPGRLGISFDGAVGLAILEVILLIIELAMAIAVRKWVAFLIALAPFILAWFILGLLDAIRTP